MPTQQETRDQATQPKKSLYERLNDEFVQKHIALVKARLQKKRKEKKPLKRTKNKKDSIYPAKNKSNLYPKV